MQFADVACALKTQTAIEDGQTGCPSFFVYWGCAKETKFFCNSVKRQKFIQVLLVQGLCNLLTLAIRN